MAYSRRTFLKASVAISGGLAGCISDVQAPKSTSTEKKDSIAQTVSIINSRSPLTENAPSINDETKFFGTILTEASDLDRLRETTTFNPKKYRNFDFDGRFISINAATLPYNRIMTGDGSNVTDERFSYRGRIEKRPDESSETRIYNVLMIWNVHGKALPDECQMKIRGTDGDIVHTTNGST